METAKNQSEAMEIRLPDANDQLQQAAYVGYTIRPGQGMNINFDIFNAELIGANASEVKTAVNAFIADAVKKAAATGIPVGE